MTRSEARVSGPTSGSAKPGGGSSHLPPVSPPCWAFADSKRRALPFPHSMPPELHNRPTGLGWQSHPLSTHEKPRTRNSLHRQRGRGWRRSLGFLSGTGPLLASLSGDIRCTTGKGAGDRELTAATSAAPSWLPRGSGGHRPEWHLLEDASSTVPTVQHHPGLGIVPCAPGWGRAAHLGGAGAPQPGELGRGTCVETDLRLGGPSWWLTKVLCHGPGGQ